MPRLPPVVLLIMGLFTSAAAAAASTPEARVRAFLADYARIHRASAKIIAASDFDRWSEAIAPLDAAHFVPGARSGLDDSMSSQPEHDPDREKITASIPQGDGVLIQTEDPDALITRYYEYVLKRLGEDWRIVQVRGYVRSPEAPFVEPNERAGFLQPTAHPYRELPPGEARLDGAALFAAGRRVQVDRHSGSIEVRRIGTLHVTSGVLVVGDLGYDAAMLGVLGRRVPPGRHPVDVSTAFGRVAAMRVTISDAPVVRWHPADMGEQGGHVVGVDAGNVAIADASALLAITARHKDRQFEQFSERSGIAGAMLLRLANPDDCAIATSGWGDGGYPVYWGVDAAGNPAVLLVDMMVLSESGD